MKWLVIAASALFTVIFWYDIWRLLNIVGIVLLGMWWIFLLEWYGRRQGKMNETISRHFRGWRGQAPSEQSETQELPPPDGREK